MIGNMIAKFVLIIIAGIIGAAISIALGFNDLSFVYSSLLAAVAMAGALSTWDPSKKEGKNTLEAASGDNDPLPPTGA